RPSVARRKVPAAHGRGYWQGSALTAVAGHRRAVRDGCARRPQAAPGGRIPLRAPPRPGARLHLQACADSRSDISQSALGAAVLHARIVEVMEALNVDRLTEQAARLAHHALQGEVWEKALTYYRQAGDKAMTRSAFREAVACFEQ